MTSLGSSLFTLVEWTDIGGGARAVPLRYYVATIASFRLTSRYSRGLLSLTDFTHDQILAALGLLIALMTAITPVLTATGAAIGSWITARRAAKREDLDYLRVELRTLRKRVDQLEAENDRLIKENHKLREHISILRTEMIRSNIQVPEFDQ